MTFFVIRYLTEVCTLSVHGKTAIRLIKFVPNFETVLTQKILLNGDGDPGILGDQVFRFSVLCAGIRELNPTGFRNGYKRTLPF